MKVYIAGPMRGLVNWNFDTFDAVEARWRDAGHHPMSPARMCRAMGYGPDCGYNAQPEDPDGAAHLRHVMLSDIAAIYASDAIALLPGWENSVGTTVELAVAQFLGLPIYDAVTMERINPASKPWSYVQLMKINAPEGVGHSY